MSTPKKRMTHSKSGMRRSSTFLKPLENIIYCKNCGAPCLNHHVCNNCGFYKGQFYNHLKNRFKDSRTA